MSTLETALNDLIMDRERVNAGLAHELYRHERLSEAAYRLKSLNDQAESLVLDTFERVNTGRTIAADNIRKIRAA